MQSENLLAIFCLGAMGTQSQYTLNRTRLVHQGLSVVREAHSPPTHTATTATNDSAPSVVDPTLEYSTERVVLFWHPPS